MASATTVDALHEAESAANDAAREARAEVLERSGAEGPIVGPERSKMRQRSTERQSASTEEWHKFVVDIWITNLNAIEFGIYKRARNRAKSRQFTAGMDVFAEVIEDGKRTSLIAYREDLWTKNDGIDRRLVFKLFTDSLNWRATMDLMAARSLQQTIGARGLPVMTYSINTNDSDQVVYIERSANKWPLLPENFSFFLLEGNRIVTYRIRQNLIRWGDDYTVYNERDEPIGHLNGLVFTIGGKWRCKVKKQYASKRLLSVLKLFTGMLIFNDDCRRHVRQTSKLVRAGKLEAAIDKQESDLYMNPRRVR